MVIQRTIKFEDIYALYDAEVKGYLHVSPETQIKNDWAIFLGDMDPGLLTFRVKYGSKKLDLVSTGYPAFRFLSKRAQEVLDEFTGWKGLPVRILDKNGEEIEGYSLLQITGRCGPIDDSKSVMQWMPAKAPGGKRYQAGIGYYFDPATWDGSDIFCPQGRAHRFVTRQVKERIEAAKLTNFSFDPITEIENSSVDIVFEKLE